MSVYRRILWAPGVLRRAGLTVVEHPGWKARGLSESQPFDPTWIVWHHDASGAGDSPGVPQYMIDHFATAAAQLWVSRAGVWHIIASGRAPHAGSVLVGKPTNNTSIGIETDHTTNEAWPPVQLSSLRTGTAALLTEMGRDESRLEFHKTICSPPGRKVDPAGLSLSAERVVLRQLLKGDDVPLTDAEIDKIATRTAAKILDDREAALIDRVRKGVQGELGDENVGELSDRIAAKVIAGLPASGGAGIDVPVLVRTILTEMGTRLKAT